MDLKEVRQAIADRKAEVTSITAAASVAGRDLTDVEDARMAAILDEVPGLRALEATAERDASVARAFKPILLPGGSITGGHVRAEDDPRRGFNHYGEFMMAVYRAAAPGGQAEIDDRLRIGAAPTTYGNEGAGADGGYLMPPEFSTRIHEHSLEGDALLPLTDGVPVAGNAMAFPGDETTPWGSNGVRAYWEAEAAQATQTKPALGLKNLRLNRLFALVPMTDDLLEDALAGGVYVERKTASSIQWKVNDALINGTGAGQPMGIANSGSLVTQAKVGSQTADTINATNIAAMFARCTNPGRGIWHVNPDAYHQLVVMTIGDQPVFTTPRDGLVAAPAGFLMGRPIRLDESCQTLGDLGDIYYADWMGYLTIQKASGVSADTSIHLWFDYGVTAFRAIFRVDGQPWASAAVTPPNSAITRSSFVTLAARA